MGPISKKVIAGLKKTKNKKIINFQELKEAKVYADNLEKTIVSEKDLSKYDPLHAVYIYAQNKVSVFVEEAICRIKINKHFRSGPADLYALIPAPKSRYTIIFHVLGIL